MCFKPKFDATATRAKTGGDGGEARGKGRTRRDFSGSRRVFEVAARVRSVAYLWPKRLRYSVDSMKARTISALTKLPLNWLSFESQKLKPEASGSRRR